LSAELEEAEPVSRTGWKSLSGASASSSSKTSEVMGRGSWYSLRPTHAELRLPIEHQLVALQREGVAASLWP
jgi:hypothetical protein